MQKLQSGKGGFTVQTRICFLDKKTPAERSEQPSNRRFLSVIVFLAAVGWFALYGLFHALWALWKVVHG